MAEKVSALAVDFGSVHTRVLLIDVVDGVYRVVARGESRTTDGFPNYDIAVGLQRVLRDIGSATGRQLMDDTGRIITPERPDRSGVDSFSITASLGRPLRAVLVGLMPDLSISAALRAAAGTYMDIVASVHLNDGRTEEERLNALVLNVPDVVFVVGGTDTGARSALLEMAKIVRLAIQMTDRPRRPLVVYAGNRALDEDMAELFDKLTTYYIAENVQPTLEREQIESARAQLALAFDTYKETRSAAFAALRDMGDAAILPTAQSYDILAEYLGQQHPGGVLIVDIGSASSILSASIDGETHTAIRTEIGLGHSAPLIVEAVEPAAVQKWLPVVVKASEISNYLANKALRPATIPVSVRELHVEQALLRASVEAMIEDARPAWKIDPGPISPAVVIGAGAALTATGNPGYTALLLLDSVQPTGIVTLMADRYAGIAALGAVAGQRPEAVVQLIDSGAIETLGTAVCPQGKPVPDRPALTLEISYEDETAKHVVNGGEVWVLPVPAGRAVTVRVKCGRGLTINGKKRVKLTLTGGSMGVLFDARGRPIVTASTVEERAAQIPGWISQATGDPVIEIDPKWLQTMVPGADNLALPAESRPAPPEGLASLLEADEEPAADGKKTRAQRRAERAAKKAAKKAEREAKKQAKAAKKAEKERKKRGADDALAANLGEVSDNELDDLFGDGTPGDDSSKKGGSLDDELARLLDED